VDDGARTVEDALEGLRRLWAAGVETVVTTPHLDASVTQTPGRLEERLEEVDRALEALRGEVTTAIPGVTLLRGHEVMLDVPDPVLSDPRLHLAETDFVLVEWPRLQVPPATGPVLTRLTGLGVRIVLAHPERYRGLDAGLRLAGSWREAGAFLQVNFGSIVGRYGDAPRKRALTLLERGWADLLSTDFHGRPHLPLHIEEARAALEHLDGAEQFDLLARRNPARILEGADPLPVPPLVGRRGLKEKVMDLLRGKEVRRDH
jgi:protein-tyrosine phosphatase